MYLRYPTEGIPNAFACEVIKVVSPYIIALRTESMHAAYINLKKLLSEFYVHCDDEWMLPRQEIESQKECVLYRNSDANRCEIVNFCENDNCVEVYLVDEDYTDYCEVGCVYKVHPIAAMIPVLVLFCEVYGLKQVVGTRHEERAADKLSLRIFYLTVENEADDEDLVAHDNIEEEELRPIVGDDNDDIDNNDGGDGNLDDNDDNNDDNNNGNNVNNDGNNDDNDNDVERNIVTVGSIFLVAVVASRDTPNPVIRLFKRFEPNVNDVQRVIWDIGEKVIHSLDMISPDDNLAYDRWSDDEGLEEEASEKVDL